MADLYARILKTESLIAHREATYARLKDADAPTVVLNLQRNALAMAEARLAKLRTLYDLHAAMLAC